MDCAHQGRSPLRRSARGGARLRPTGRGGERRAGGHHLDRIGSRGHYPARRLGRVVVVRTVDAGDRLTEERGQAAGTAVVPPRLRGSDGISTSMIVTAADAPPGAIALRCAGLVKRYADVVAVNGLDLEVRTGECFGLLGPNGAGKTTTIEILEGLTRHDAGEVEVLGHRWGRRDGTLRQRLGIQLQETQLNYTLSVEETLRLFRSFYDRGRSTDEVLGIVELESKRTAWVGKLSGGQKQRLAIGCALVGRPEVLFL